MSKQQSADPWTIAASNLPKTIEDIDALVFSIYTAGGEGEGRLNTKPNAKNLVTDTFPINSPNPFIGYGLESVDTSCNLYDCLVHSFLIDISPNFRKLTRGEKNEFASNFRRKILIKYSQITNASQYGIDLISELKRERFFLPTDLALILSNIFNINIFIIDIYGLSSVIYRNRTFVKDALKPGKPVIFIYNPDNAHFRAVRRLSDKIYIFPYAEGEALVYQLFDGKASMVPTVEARRIARNAVVTNLRSKGVTSDNLERIYTTGSTPENFKKSLNNGQTLKNLRTKLGVKNYTENIDYLKKRHGFINANIPALSRYMNPSDIRTHVNFGGLKRKNIYSQLGLVAPTSGSISTKSQGISNPGAGSGPISTSTSSTTNNENNNNNNYTNVKNALKAKGFTNTQIELLGAIGEDNLFLAKVFAENYKYTPQQTFKAMGLTKEGGASRRNQTRRSRSRKNRKGTYRRRR